MRMTGIDIVGDAPWGTHFCQFYKTAQELTAVLVPYFLAGLQSRECCMWITSSLAEEEAQSALRNAIPELDYYLEKKQLLILPYDKWYLKDGAFDSERVIRGWHENLDRALKMGFEGLRVAGDAGWLKKKGWSAFARYQRAVDDMISRSPMMVLCCYLSDAWSAPEILEITRTHEFALVKTSKGWDLIQGSGPRAPAQKRAERRLNLLAETAEQLLRTDSPQQVIDSLCQKVLEFLDCQCFFNYLVDDVQQCLVLNACAGIPQEEAEKIKRLDFGAAVCGCAALEGQRIVRENIQHTTDIRTDLVRSYGIQCYACHPLISNDQVLGTLSFGTSTKTSFTEDELSLMKAVADQVAIAIERQRAQENLQQMNAILELRVAARTAELKAEALVRQRSQQALQEQARFLESFFQYSVNPLAFLDRKFNFIRVNQAYADACQRKPEEFIGRNHFEFYPHAENQAIFEEVVRSKKPFVASARPFAFPDHPEWGVTYWDWALVPVLNAEGEVDFLYFSLKDVTKAKRAEEELRRSYTYSRTLLEASLDPLVTISPEGRITDVNKATELVTGVSREHLIGSSFPDYFTEPKKADEGYQRVLSEGLVRDYLLTIRHASGNTTDVLYNATVYRDDSGRTQGVFAAARDVTQLRAAERRRDFTNDLLKLFAEKESLKEYLDAVLQVVRDWTGSHALGIRIVTPEETLPFISSIGLDSDFLQAENGFSLNRNNCVCTRAFRQAYDLHEQCAVTSSGSFYWDNGGEFVSRLPASQRSAYYGNCLRCGFRSMAVIPIGYRGSLLGSIHLMDSREALFAPATIEFLESMAPLIGEAIHRFHAEEELANYRDRLEELVKQRTGELEAANNQLKTEIAERKVAEKNLSHAAEELGRSNRDLEQFAYVASHDLQEPLRAVAGYIQLLQSRYTDKLDEKALQYITGAVDGVARMQRLITDLLAFSRVGTRGKSREWTDLSIPLDSALKNLDLGIKEANAKITSDPLPKLRVDRTLMAQLFQNLIGNAIKFRNQDPLHVHIGAAKKNGEWLFSVRDNGIGIDPKYAERIFMIFQRLHTRTKYPGTGMGLAICKRIVEQHDGRIWVESEPGNGATFFFTIPD